MAKLSDTQTILLSTAAQRDSGSVYPLSDKLNARSQLAKAVTGLLERGLVDERETVTADQVHRSDGDLQHGMYATAVGLREIGVEDGVPTEAKSTSAQTAVRTTKSEAVLALLNRESGATLSEPVEATGWLPHTTRAALTGLRKKGHNLGDARQHQEPACRLRPADEHRERTQQVNNGRAASHASNQASPPNKLLETEHGKRLEPGTAGAAIGSDPALETVGATDGAADGGRQGKHQPQRRQGRQAAGTQG